MKCIGIEMSLNRTKMNSKKPTVEISEYIPYSGTLLDLLNLHDDDVVNGAVVLIVKMFNGTIHTIGTTNIQGGSCACCSDNLGDHICGYRVVEISKFTLDWKTFEQKSINE